MLLPRIDTTGSNTPAIHAGFTRATLQHVKLSLDRSNGFGSDI